MKRNRYIKYVASSLFLFGIVMVAHAQTTPASLEVQKEKSLWFKSSNAAGLLLDNPIKYSSANISYETVAGSFHRPQTGDKENNLSFATEGAMLFDDVYAWGGFNYSRKSTKDAAFNASIIDPFRGMPYMVADIHSSDWNYQFYDLSFKVSTNKFNENVFLGFEGKYEAHGAAKQRDPRTENNSYQLTLNPSVVFAINEKHNLGFNVKYYNFKEESGMSVSNVYVDQTYYTLYGLGRAIERVGRGYTTNYEANSWGGGLHYNFNDESWNILLSSDYNYKVEDVAISFTTPRNDGTVKDGIWKTKLQLMKKGENLGHHFMAEYTERDIDGIEYITEYDNDINNPGYKILHKDIRSTYKTKEATFDYDLSLNRGNEYTWKVGAGVKYKKQDDTYLLPRSVKNYETLAFQVRAKRNIFLSNELSRRLLIGADFSISNSLSGKYEYNGGFADYVTVTRFETSDLNYLITDFYSVGGSAVYSQQVKKGSQANLFAKVDLRYTKARDFGYGNRHSALFSIGCNF